MSESRNQAEQVRLYVDGEMSPADLEQFAEAMAADPALAAQVRFEQSLRDRVHALMDTPETRAPSGLVDRVRAAIETDEASPAKPRRIPWWDNPRRANAVAVAASLALVAGAVLWGIFGRPIDRVPPLPNMVAEIALYASQEHTTYAMDETKRKGISAPAQKAAIGLSAFLGAEIVLPDLRSLGYEFMGGRESGIPGEPRSGHILYGNRAKGALVSLFVVPDDGQIDDGADGPMEVAAWYRTEGGPDCDHKVLRCTDQDLVYFLVCCSEQDIDPVSAVVLDTIRFAADVRDGLGRSNGR